MMQPPESGSGPTPFPLPAGPFFDVNALERLLVACAQAGVADITLQSGDLAWGRLHRTYVALTDRVLQDAEIVVTLQHLYGSTGQAELLSGKPLDFRCSVQESRDHERAFRGNAVRARVGANAGGITITLRTIPGLPPTLDALGIEPPIVDALFPRYGIVLVVGTTGSGKSTLLAAANRWRLERRQDDPVKIITFENPIEYTYAGLARGRMPEPAQTEIGRGEHLSDFLAVGPNAMRRAADVIVMGEMRDVRSVEEGVALGETGHAMYSTLHVETPAQAVGRVLSFYPHEQRQAIANKLMTGLRLIVAQKLARDRQGATMAFRSWVVFDEALRALLRDMPQEDWVSYLTQLCARQGTDFTTQARAAYRGGRISFDVARDVAGLTKDEARQAFGGAAEPTAALQEACV